jgi:aspartate aminotransferase
LLDFDLQHLARFLEPVKVHLRRSANQVREKLKESDLGQLWYRSHSAFYFMLDFSRTPMFARFAGEHPENDYSKDICQELLEVHGVALVPGADFGLPNSARMSLTMEEVPFQEALNRLALFLNTR